MWIIAELLNPLRHDASALDWRCAGTSIAPAQAA
jgi:hypothetical protein